MKKLITNYVFDKTAKTITFSDYGSITLENVLLVTNVTSNVIIYHFAQPAKGGSVSGNVLTLTYNTGSMSNTDHLQIFYDDPATVTGQTKITDGTTTASVQAGDSAQNALVTTGSRKEISFSTTTAQAVAATEVSNYRWVSVHVTSQGSSSTITFQGSNDNINWASLTLQNTGNGAAQGSTTTVTNNVIFQGGISSRYFRLNVSGISAGTTAGTIEFFSIPSAQQTIGVGGTITQSGTWTVGANSATGASVPANTFYTGMNSAGNLVGLTSANSFSDGAGGGALLSTATDIYNGSTYDRVRAASSASGTTGTGLLGVGALGFDGTNYQRIKVDTAGILQVNQSDGTTTANNIAGDSGQNAHLVAGNRKEVTFTTTTAQAVASTDVSNYAWVSLQVTSYGPSSTIAPQVSNDNTTWYALNLGVPSTSTFSSGITSVIFAHGPLGGARYFRINVTGIASGTTAGTLEFKSMAGGQQSVYSNQGGNWAVGSSTATGAAAPANAFYMGMRDVSGNLIGTGNAQLQGDGGTGSSAVAAALSIFNGASYDRVRSSGLSATPGVLAVSSQVKISGTTSDNVVSAGLLGDAATPVTLGVAPIVYNGANWDRQRTASTANNTTGVGLLGVGALGYDGTNFQRLKVDTSGNQTLGASTTGGYTPGKLIAAGSTNATNIKASAGTLGYISTSNTNAAARYLKIYDKATAPTVGTDTPVHTFLIPGNASGATTSISIPPQGILCASGISFALTTGATDADTGAVTASEVIVNYGYK